MMYQDKIVVALKVGGRVLREAGDTVTLPFGAEYSVLLKNLNSVRVQVAVSIDGQDAMEGSRLILPPNSSLDLERFMKNGNLLAGNRFKFIERTAAIEEHRGVGAEDGLIRIEVWKEFVQKFVSVPIQRPYYPQHWPPPTPRRPFLGSARVGQQQAKGGGPLRSAGFMSFDTPSVNMASCSVDPERGETGITVAGSQSNQQFYSACGFPLEPGSTVMVLRLRGAIAGTPVTQPVTVDVKPECITCGRIGEANDEFCARCGTAISVLV